VVEQYVLRLSGLLNPELSDSIGFKESISHNMKKNQEKVEGHSGAWEDLKDMIINLDQKVDRRIDALDQKVDGFRGELASRIDSLDQRFSSRIESLDQKIDRRSDALEQKFSRYFFWIIGIQVTIFLSIIATLLKS
jgi:tetrahydromethanopterin S-methyltransferase subunit G